MKKRVLFIRAVWDTSKKETSVCNAARVVFSAKGKTDAMSATSGSTEWRGSVFLFQGQR